MSSYTETSNLTFHELNIRLGSSKNFAERSCFQIRAVYRRKKTPWRLHACTIEKVDSSNENWIEEYVDNVFVVSYVWFNTLREIIDALKKGEIEVSKEYPRIGLPQETRWNEILIPSFASGSGIPTRHISARIESTNWGDESLIGHSLPYYQSFVSRGH
jgi:hypothetical protein